MKTVYRKSIFTLLPVLLFAFTAAAEYIPAFEKTADWQWGDDVPVLSLPAITGTVLVEKNHGTFAGSVNGSWTDDGLVFFAEVVDENLENPNSDTELWKGDACEFFIVAPGNEPFEAGSRIQAIVSAPDENGNCRTYIYADSPEIPAKHFKAAGTRTAKGYKITAFFPWEAMGRNAEEMIRRDGFRFNMFADDFGGNVLTHSARQDTMTNRDSNPFFMLTEKITADGTYDVRMRSSTPVTGIVISKTDAIQKDVGEACTAILKDIHGNILAEKNFPDGRIFMENPGNATIFLEIFKSGNTGKLFVARQNIAVVDFTEPEKCLKNPENPADRVKTLGVINALECIKSPSQLDDVPNELAWRMCKFKGEDVSNAPAPLCFLNLTGDPAGLVQVGIGRRGPMHYKFNNALYEYSTLTVQWGGIPVVYADILCFEDAASAQAAVASFRHMRHQLPVELPEADAVYAGHGFILEGAIPTDMDPEHLVCVFDPAAPAVVTRVTPEIALEYSGAKAFVVRNGANPEHITIMKNAGLQEITAAEAAKADAPVIHLGMEGLNVPIRGKSYRHTRYGIPDDMIIACKGNIAVQTSFAVPEMAKEVIKAIFDCKPVSKETVNRWRQMRLDSLGGDLPEFRALGRLVRTGDTHTHTLYSDGGSTPGTLLAEAIAGGMDFMILTDHDTIAGAEKMSKVLTETSLDFPFITGCELTMNDAYHLNVFPLQKLIDKTGKSHAELIAEARAQGAVVMLNHPMTYGINLRNFWYTSLAGSGIDAVERNLEQREVWRQNGYEGAFLGSTDTHYGVFGHMERSVFLLEEVTGEAIAEEVIAKRCGMIAPDLPGFVYGSEDVCNAVRAALGDPDLPEYHGKRLDKTFAEFDLQKFIQHGVIGKNSPHDYGWQGNAGEIITVIPDRE